MRPLYPLEMRVELRRRPPVVVATVAQLHGGRHQLLGVEVVQGGCVDRDVGAVVPLGGFDMYVGDNSAVGAEVECSGASEAFVAAEALRTPIGFVRASGAVPTLALRSCVTLGTDALRPKRGAPTIKRCWCSPLEAVVWAFCSRFVLWVSVLVRPITVKARRIESMRVTMAALRTTATRESPDQMRATPRRSVRARAVPTAKNAE
jgi:hypothetical protein